MLNELGQAAQSGQYDGFGDFDFAVEDRFRAGMDFKAGRLEFLKFGMGSAEDRIVKQVGVGGMSRSQRLPGAPAKGRERRVVVRCGQKQPDAD